MGVTGDLNYIVQLSVEVAELSSTHICSRRWLLRKHKSYLREVSALAEIFLSIRQAITDAETPSLVYSLLDNDVLGDCRRKLALLHSNLEIWTLNLSESYPEKDLKEYVGPLRDLRANFTSFFSYIATIAKATYEKIASLSEEWQRDLFFTYIPSRHHSLRQNTSGADHQEQTPLHWACRSAQFPVAERLVNDGADINTQDIRGWTPLIHAAFTGSLELIRLLLSNGADYHIRSKYGWTALHWAIYCGHYDIVQELFEYHSRSQVPEPVLQRMTVDQVEAYVRGTFPVLIAADTRDMDIFCLVVEHLELPDIWLKNYRFNTIWDEGKLDASDYFSAEGNPWRNMTKEEACNGRAFGFGIPSRETDFERYRGDPTEWKCALLLCAIRDQQLPVIQMLLKAGADINYKKALYAAACQKDTRYLRLLLDNGADPKQTDGNGHSVLHEAVLNGFLDVITTLIDAGADVNQAISKHCTSGFVHMYNNVRIDSCTIRVTSKGATPLMQACGFMLAEPGRYQHRRPELTLPIVRLLLSRGADTRLRDASGMTALHYAVLRPQLPVIRLLIESGSPIDAVDQEGRTPFHYLARCAESEFTASDLREIVLLFLKIGQNLSIGNLINNPVDETEDLTRATDPHQHARLVSKVIRQANLVHTIKRIDDGLTPLGIAIREGKMKMVQILTEHGANFQNDTDTNLALGHAIEQLETDMVDFLLSRGARPMQTAVTILVKSFIDRYKDTELHEDDTSKFVHILSKIILAGADVDPYTLDTDGSESPLTLAARVRGSKTLLRSLLSFEADVTSASETFDPILTAAVFGDIEDVTCLLEHASIHTNPGHWPWFLKDVPKDKSPILRICLCLKRAGTLNSINKSGRTLLHLAAERGNIPLITSLLSCGARADIQDAEGFLPMQCAGFAQSASGLLALFPFSINNMQLAPKERRRVILGILERRNTSNKRIFDLAMECNDVYLASLLLQFRIGADSWVKRYLERPWRALHQAAEQGRIEMVSLLLSHHASVEAKDTSGWRALHVACYRGHTEIAKMLIQAGANIHTTTQRWNSEQSRPSMLHRWDRWKGQPLHLAAMGGHAEVFKLLLEHGANIHAKTGKSVSSPGHGPTALHLVLDTGMFYGIQGDQLSAERLEIAQILVDLGAMVKGIIRDYSLEEILRFKNFPGLWDALVAGDS